MATLDDVRAVLLSNDDPAHKLDRLAAIVFQPEPEPQPAPKAKPRAAKVEPEPDAA